MHTIVPWLSALLVSFLPAQLEQSSEAPMALERHEGICTFLSPAECCEEMLKLASFRATRQHLPERAALAVRIGCQVSKDTLAKPSMCPSIVSGRAFSSAVAKRACAPKKIRKRCRADEVCRACTKELAALDYPKAYPACHAVTYSPSGRRGPKVVRMPSDKGGKSPSNATVIAIPKRRVLD